MAQAGQTAADVHIRWLATEPERRVPSTGRMLMLAITAAAVFTASQVGIAPNPTLRIVSGSMEPTLSIGEVVRLNTSAYSSIAPHVGDIVAFRAPTGAIGSNPVCGVAQNSTTVCEVPTSTESHAVFVKRIVAAPGDTIAILNGTVVRNGVVQSESFTTPCEGDGGCNFPAAVRVPVGDWFVMGDNRTTSDDSRYWGPVPRSWIVGKVLGSTAG